MEQTCPSKGAVARLIPLPALAPGPFHDLVQREDAAQVCELGLLRVQQNSGSIFPLLRVRKLGCARLMYPG